MSEKFEVDGKHFVYVEHDGMVTVWEVTGSPNKTTQVGESTEYTAKLLAHELNGETA